jgi:hypothetical protein
MKDISGIIFGAFVTESFITGKIHGTGESFLFTNKNS